MQLIKYFYLFTIWLLLLFFIPLGVHGNEYRNLFFDLLDEGEEVDPLAITEKASVTQYILYAPPGGTLGNQLSKFWKDVKNKQLNHPPVLTYPSHISLTSFFTAPNTKAQEKNLISAPKYAIEQARGHVPIKLLTKSINQSESIDAILFKYSPILAAVIVNFLDRAGISFNYFWSLPNSMLGYHITLRQITTSTTTIKVQELEAQNIHLALNLEANTTWALYIYKKVGKYLIEINHQSVH